MCVVWLKVGPGWVKLNPLVPRANQGFGFNVAGSPNWGALICQPTIMNPRWFSATKGECISREEAEEAWRGESVSDFRMGWNGDQGSLEDRAQLSTFYHATDGPNWTRKSNWTAAAALSDWYGVSMDDGGRVTGLELRGNGLTGPIPPALGELSLLSILDLGVRRSFFSGRLIENALTGPIPSALGGLTELRTLALSGELSGPIPAVLGNLANLETLMLASDTGLCLASDFPMASTFARLALAQGIEVCRVGTGQPITPGTPIRAVHFRELRVRIATLREREGLPAMQWTDPTLVAGSTPVKGVHLRELRTALDAVYRAVGQVPRSYTDPSLTPGATAIKALHVMELRARVAALE